VDPRAQRRDRDAGRVAGDQLRAVRVVGVLWVGLRYRDGMDARPYGIATIETATGKVSYHRTGAVPSVEQRHMLPIPIGVVDGDVRGDTAWFATSEGVARLVRGQSRCGTRPTAAVRGRARRDDREQRQRDRRDRCGAGIWTARRGRSRRRCGSSSTDVVATRNGQVWMATERGIAAWDGSKVRRVDMRRGLAENRILDVAVDQFDRVWARGGGSLTLISQ